MNTSSTPKFQVNGLLVFAGAMVTLLMVVAVGGNVLFERFADSPDTRNLARHCGWRVHAQYLMLRLFWRTSSWTARLVNCAFVRSSARLVESTVHAATSFVCALKRR